MHKRYLFTYIFLLNFFNKSSSVTKTFYCNQTFSKNTRGTITFVFLLLLILIHVLFRPSFHAWPAFANLTKADRINSGTIGRHFSRVGLIVLCRGSIHSTLTTFKPPQAQSTDTLYMAFLPRRTMPSPAAPSVHFPSKTSLKGM